MKLEIPHNIGDCIMVGGQKKRIVSMHIYVSQNGGVLQYRFYIGNNQWISIPAEQ